MGCGTQFSDGHRKCLHSLTYHFAQLWGLIEALWMVSSTLLSYNIIQISQASSLCVLVCGVQWILFEDRQEYTHRITV